jgi:hypothetical protein
VSASSPAFKSLCFQVLIAGRRGKEKSLNSLILKGFFNQIFLSLRHDDIVMV